MNEKDLKRIIKDWADQIGTDMALIKLLKVGISPGLAHKLIAGSYEHTLKEATFKPIIKAMKKGA